MVTNRVPRPPRSKLSLTRLRHPIEAMGVHERTERAQYSYVMKAT